MLKAKTSQKYIKDALRLPDPQKNNQRNKTETTQKSYLKATPLRSLTDLNSIKQEIKTGNILIIKVTPLANKNIEETKKAINELCEFTKTIDGDIARLGEERIVITPPNIRIWREKPLTAEEQTSTAT